MIKVYFSITLLLTAHWSTLQTRVTARLRGLSAVTEKIVWTSGSASTVLRTTDGGGTWQKLLVTSDQLDFRDVDAIDASTVYLLSIGNGPVSRIYKTTDGGASWQLQFRNEDPKAFLDAMSFWDPTHGIVIGDSIDGQFYILTTVNGRDWNRVPESSLPPAIENEGAFAASGSNIALIGKSEAWIATGGAAKSRVLHTKDAGRTWTVADTPIKAASSAGIFSIAFRDAKHGIVVGGDYSKENDAIDNAAITTDGGRTWKLIKGLSGYRSAVAYVPGTKSIVAVGPGGADYSTDDGNTWTPIIGSGFDTLSFARRSRRQSAVGFAAGVRGTMGRLEF